MEQFETTKYMKDFINQVICRIDFIDFISNDIISDVSILKPIKEKYPVTGKDQIVQLNQINIEVVNPLGAPNIQGQSTSSIQKTFSSSDGKNKFILSNQFVILDIRSYTTFEDLMDNISKVLIAIYKKKAFLTNRIGIRYVNIFDEAFVKVQKNHFTDTISKSLDVLQVDDPSIKPIRAIQTVEYTLNDMLLQFRYGLFNKLYPNEMKGRDFVLDFDCYAQEAVDNSDGVIRYLKKGHDAIQLLFERSITNKLRSVMNNG